MVKITVHGFTQDHKIATKNTNEKIPTKSWSPTVKINQFNFRKKRGKKYFRRNN